jgi:hypothetical protein
MGAVASTTVQSAERPMTQGVKDVNAAACAPEGKGRQRSVVAANPDHIDRLGVVAYYSIAVRALVHGANRLTFRLVSEPCCAPAGDSRAAPPTRSPSTLREAVETHARGSTLVGVVCRVWLDWQSGSSL